MAWGILLLRVVVGLTFAAHGSQKLFGWLGGGGLRGTADVFGRTIGYRWPVLAAVAAGTAEFGGGLLFAAGLVTPAAALALSVVMLNAIVVVHWRNGFFNQNGGLEFPLVMLSIAVGVTASGPQRYSLDRLIGWSDNISGVRWGAGMLAAAIVISFLATTIGRARPETTEVPA